MITGTSDHQQWHWYLFLWYLGSCVIAVNSDKMREIKCAWEWAHGLEYAANAELCGKKLQPLKTMHCESVIWNHLTCMIGYNITLHDSYTWYDTLHLKHCSVQKPEMFHKIPYVSHFHYDIHIYIYIPIYIYKMQQIIACFSTRSCDVLKQRRLKLTETMIPQ